MTARQINGSLPFNLSTISSGVALAKTEAVRAKVEALKRSRPALHSFLSDAGAHKQGKSRLSADNPYALDLQALIKPVIDQIVRVARPDRIILFGSALTGRMTTDSDLDFLVVVPDQAHPELVIDRLNMEVRRKPAPCDFLVATRSMLKAHSTRCASIFKMALKEGEEVYAG